jgi:phospholipase/lecithinase/hemolysin
LGLTAASSDVSTWFNNDILGLMNFGAGLGLHMNLLDMAALGRDIQAHPGSFGITNTSLPCAGFDFAPIPGTSCSASAFSDVLHPSALVHSLFAQAALGALGVPEPGTLALFGLALLVLHVARRRRRV